MENKKFQYLNEATRLKIIEELEGPNSRSKRALGRFYNVSEGAIRKTWINREVIKRRSKDFSDEDKNTKLRVRMSKLQKFDSKLHELVERGKELPESVSKVMGEAKEKRLTEAERLKIIKELEGDNPRSKQALARAYNVSGPAIGKTWNNRELIKRRSKDFSEEVKNKRLRVERPIKLAIFPELESKVEEWVGTREKLDMTLPMTASLVMGKAEEMATQMNVEDFKASNKWYQRFKERKGLKMAKPCGEVKSEPEPLFQLDDLYKVFELNDVYPEVDAKTKRVQFEGYRKLLEKAAETEKQLNCEEAFQSAPEVYDELKMTHDHFLHLLKKATNKEKLNFRLNQASNDLS